MKIGTKSLEMNRYRPRNKKKCSKFHETRL